MNNEICHEHSGCISDINTLKSENVKQWEAITAMGNKVDGIMTRLNVILGGIVVAVIMLLLNIVVKIV